MGRAVDVATPLGPLSRGKAREAEQAFRMTRVILPVSRCAIATSRSRTALVGASVSQTRMPFDASRASLRATRPSVWATDASASERRQSVSVTDAQVSLTES